MAVNRPTKPESISNESSRVESNLDEPGPGEARQRPAGPVEADHDRRREGHLSLPLRQAGTWPAGRRWTLSVRTVTQKAVVNGQSLVLVSRLPWNVEVGDGGVALPRLGGEGRWHCGCQAGWCKTGGEAAAAAAAAVAAVARLHVPSAWPCWLGRMKRRAEEKLVASLN